MRRVRHARWLALLSILGSFLPSARAQADAPPYKIVARYRVGGEGGWDYLTVDPLARRLYVARGSRVQVLHIDSGKSVGEIADTPGVHGVALAPDLGRGFTSNGRDSTVTVFDLRTLAPLARLHVGAQNPDAILYEPVTHRVFTLNGGSGTATAIDARADSVVGTVVLGGRPEYGVADGRGQVFVNLEDSSAVVGFDAQTLSRGPHWPLAPGATPTGLAIDAAHRVLVSACRNQRAIVLDADSGRVLSSLPIGAGVDGVVFDPATGLAITSNGEGTLTVLQEDARGRFTVVGTIATQRGARTLALDPSTSRIYLATAEFDAPAAPTKENPKPRPSIVPNSFTILVLAR